MPRPWTPSIYRTHDAQTAPPAAHEVGGLMEAVDDCSERLQKRPYDFGLWLQRAGYFLSLNYPELAAGDAYRATLLFDQDPSDTGERVSDKTRLSAYDLLGHALYDCHSHWELAEFWEAVSKKLPADIQARNKAASINELLRRKKEAAAPLGGTLLEQKDRIRDGGIITIHYAWMQQRHLTRSPELVALVNDELSKSVEQQTCYCDCSTLSARKTMLGMFAARDIQPGERILIDRTATGVCSSPESGSCNNCYGRVTGSPTRGACCSAIYCSPECHNLAMSTYHHALCGQDFTWLLEPAKGLSHNASPLRPLLMLRFLAASIQADLHPLDHPLIARLQPLADQTHLDVFTFTESITTPLQILRQLGIDIFANHDYDTMTLHTIWTRIANNKAGSPDPRHGFVDLVSPHLALFNHSCEPNVEWRRSDGSTTVWFFAKRRIEKGDELFSSYLDVEGRSRDERIRLLWPWFEGECLCAKCKREYTQVKII